MNTSILKSSMKRLPFGAFVSTSAKVLPQKNTSALGVAREAHPHVRFRPMRSRYVTRMCSADSFTDRSSSSSSPHALEGLEKDSAASARRQQEKEREEDDRLQHNKRYIFREFGKVALAAIGILVILFCLDILVSLLALTLGGLYIIAVLLKLHFVTDFVARAGVSFQAFSLSVMKTARDIWVMVRRSVISHLQESK